MLGRLLWEEAQPYADRTLTPAQACEALETEARREELLARLAHIDGRMDAGVDYPQLRSRRAFVGTEVVRNGERPLAGRLAAAARRHRPVAAWRQLFERLSAGTAGGGLTSVGQDFQRGQVVPGSAGYALVRFLLVDQADLRAFGVGAVGTGRGAAGRRFQFGGYEGLV